MKFSIVKSPFHYQLNFYGMTKNPYPVLKYFFTINFFFLEVTKDETLYLVACEEARFFYHRTYASLKVFARRKPNTGYGLVFLYLMRFSHFSSESLHEILNLHHFFHSLAANLIVFDCNWTRTQNHLVLKQTLSHLEHTVNSLSLLG